MELKTQKENSEAFKENSKVLKEENEAKNKILKEKAEHLNVNLVKLKNASEQNENLNQSLVEIQTELQKLKQAEQKPMIKCDECDTSVQTYDQLKLHYRRFHSYNKYSQCGGTSIFEEYPCFYCDEPIASENDLETHLDNCNEKFEPSTPEYLFF